jgi:hypothetical protein
MMRGRPELRGLSLGLVIGGLTLAYPIVMLKVKIVAIFPA